MTTAFVLSGGASLGAIQVGMARALEEADVAPEMIVGTSVGAINGSWLASGRPIEGLADVWRGMRRSDLFPLRPLVGLRGFLGHRNNFVPNGGLRTLLERNIDFARIEDAPIPLTVITSDALSGAEVALTEGPVVPALMASAAIPGVFVPIEIDGRALIDGGVANNTPITRAIDAGATEVWGLSTGYSCALARPPKGAVAMAMHAVALLVQQRLALEIVTREYPVPVHLVPSPCPITVPPTDFSQTADLIDRAHFGTRQWLSNGCPHAMPLGLHRHSHDVAL